MTDPPIKTTEATAKSKGLKSESILASAWRILKPVLIVYLIILLAAMFLETTLMFPASRYPDGDWEPPRLNFEDAEFAAEDGTKLHGWYVPAENPRAYVLFCHGNAGNITHRADVVRQLQSQHQVSVLVFDYRGYGKSKGRPNEEGVISDARAARTWLAEREGIDEREMVLLGRSLGGAVAVALAAEQPPAGLILESTFSSMTDVAAYHYPILPVRLILRNRFDSMSRIDRYHGPLLVSHSETDEVIPFKFGKKLFDAAPSENKHLVRFEQLSHNDYQPYEYDVALRDFFDGLPKPAKLR